jgi:hypothetical protein
MAGKKQKVDIDDYGMDFDFDDDWDDGETTFNPSGSSSNGSRNPVLNSGKTVLKSMGETALTPAFVRDTLKVALPKEFSTTLDNLDRYSGDFRKMQQDISTELRPTLNSFKQMTRTVNRLIPNPFQDKIEKLLANKDTGPDLGKVDLEQAAVDSQLGEVFAQQQQQDRNQERAEKVIDRMSQEDFRSKIFDAVSAIRNATVQSNSYQMSVQRAYQRKSLEIRIRQLVATRGILDVTRKSAEESSQLLRDIVKNTGLPEFAKEEASEHFHRLARQRLFGAAQENIGEFMRNYMSKVGKGYADMAKEKMQQFRGFFDSGRQMADDIEMQAQQMRDMGMDPKEMALELFGQSLMQRVGTRAGAWVGKRLPYRQGASNLFGYANEFATNLPANMRNLARKQQYGGFLHSALKPFDQSYNDGGVVRTGGLSGLTGNNDMEMRKVRALEEIIPGYLSRILHSIDIMRTGNENLPRTVYSGQKGAFVQFDEAVKLVRKSALNDTDIEDQQGYVKQLVDQIDPTGKLRGKDRDVLERHLMKEMHGVNRWDPEAIANKGVDGVTGRGNRLLSILMKDRYGLQHDAATGKYSAHLWKSRNDLRDQDSQIFKRGQDRVKALRPSITGITNSGDMEAAIAEGLVIWDGSNWVMNTKYYDERSADLLANKRQRVRIDPHNPAAGANGFSSGLGGGPTPPPPAAGGFGGMFDRFKGHEEKEGNISNRNGRGIIKAIRDQTDELMTFLEPKGHTDHEMYQHMIDAIDEVAEILEQGVTLNGTGGASTGGAGERKKSLIRRALSRARKGGTWAGKKIWDISGYPMRALNWARKKIPGRKMFNWGSEKLKNFGSKVDALRSDVYVMGVNGFRRALDMAGFAEGRYRDMKTGKPIFNIKDITGAVYDTILGKQVLSEEEFQGGLLNSLGKKIKDGVIGRVKNAGSRVMGWVTNPVTSMWANIKKGMQGAKEFLMAPPDIYVLGETTPRCKGDLFYRGFYYSGVTGKPLKTLGDIDGDIITFDNISGERKVVISKDEIERGLYDSRGNKLTSLLTKFKNAAGWARDKVKGLWNAPKRLLDWAKNGIKGIGTGLGKLLGGTKPEIGQTYWLKRIFHLLYNKFSGKPLGEGLSEALKETGNKVGEAASRLKDEAVAKGRKWWKFGRSKYDEAKGSVAAQKAAEYRDQLKERSGSWLNRQIEAGKNKYHAYQAGKPLGDKKEGIFGLLKNGFGLIGGVLMGIKQGFGTFAGKLFGWLPKLLMAKRGADLAGDIADVASGAGGRGRGGLLRRGARALGKGAWWAAKGLTVGGGGMLLRGGMALASMAGGLLSAPVVLGLAVAGGAAYLIYKGWKAYSERLDLMQRMRLAQYGADLGNKEQCGKILAFEETVLSKYTRTDGNGGVTLQPMPFGELMQAFGVNPSARFTVHNWANWFDRRFKPVFIKNVSELYKVSPKGNLAKSGSYDNGLKPQLAKATKIEAPASQSPYYVQQSPFPNQTSRTGTAMVDATIAAVVEEYGKDEKTYRGRQEVQEQQKGKVAVDANGNYLAATTVDPDAKVIKGQKLTYQAGPNNRILDQMGGLGDRSTMARITGDQATDDALLKNNRIDDLTSIRLKVYGLTSLDRIYVDTLMQFERDMYQNVTVANNGVASFNGNADDVYNKYCAKFSLGFGDTDARITWTTWFQNRFLPAFLNFVAQTKKINPNQDVFTAWQSYKAADLLKIANFVSDARATVNGQRISVWAVKVSPFPGETAGTDGTVIQKNLEVFKQAQEKEQYQESEAAARAIREKYTGVKVNALSDKGRVELTSRVNNLMADMAKATGNTSGYQGIPTGGAYGTSFESAGTGGMYGSGNVPKVKLSGSAKQHADTAMKFAQANGIAGEELALFMGTLAHESGNFSATLEKGSGARYENNKNLGNTQPGDGERFKGRGWIQLTGRNNYAHYGKLTGLDLLNHPELAEIPENANKLAVAYWQDRVIPMIRQKRAKFDVLSVARAVNGWFEDRMPNGMDDRILKTNQWRQILNGGGDIPLSDRGASENPGGQVQAGGGQETTPPLSQAAKAANPYDSIANSVTSPKGGAATGQETVPSIANAATDPIPTGSGRGLQNLKGMSASNPTMQPQANPSAEVVDHKRLQVARSVIENNQVRQTQQAVTEQAKATGSAVEWLEKSYGVQNDSLTQLKQLVKIISEGGLFGAANEKKGESKNPSTAERTMNDIPIKSGLGQNGSGALPFSTKRGG